MWLVAAMRSGYPCPVLVLEGAQGSGKSTTQRYLRNVLDPNIAAVRSQPREESDLVIAARNGALVSLDNVSNLPGWLSDGLCRVATGGGLSKRTLYTDLDETLVEVRRPIVLNGISDFLSRPDLVDRSIILNLSALSETDYWDERTARVRFGQSHTEILGGLLDLVAGVLREVDQVEGYELPRMADFGITVLALERVDGVRPTEYLNLYKSNREEAATLMIEASTFIESFVDYLMQPNQILPQARTATEWLNTVNEEVDEVKRRAKEWPKDGTRFSSLLSRYQPNLERIGIVFKRHRDGRKRLITINRVISD